MDAITLENLARWVHVVSGVGWLGQVLVVIFVLVPALRRLEGESQKRFLQEVFPRVFRLASVLSVTAIATGTMVYLARFDWRVELGVLTTTTWGGWILAGAILGGLLTAFHFLAEAKLEPAVSGVSAPEDVDRMVRIVTVVPRIGVFVLLGAVVAMMYAAHGV